MNQRTRVMGKAAVWATALVVAPMAAWGTGLAYRSVSTGRWIGIAANGDVRSSGAYVGKTFTGFTATAKAPVSGVTGTTGTCTSAASVAVFSGKVVGAAPNTGLFLYDGATDTIYDAVIEGSATPIGGTWASFTGVTPAVTIDPPTCLIHLIFPGRAVGVAGSSDTGIFDASFGPLPSVALAGIATVAQEGVTAPPAPFPGAAVFANFPSSLHVAALADNSGSGIGYSAAFRGQVTGGGVTGANDTGVFMCGTVPPGGITTATREGDVTCPPTFGGTMFADFPATMNLGVGGPGLAGAVVAFAARSNGPPASDTAIVNFAPGVGCGTAFVFEQEGNPTPLGGTYADFPSSTPVGNEGVASNAAVFPANVIGGSASKGLFYSFGPSFTGAVVAQGQAGTALGAGAVSIPSNVEPVINVSRKMAFRVTVAGAGSGLFYFDGNGSLPAESLGGGYRGAQIDLLGNITACFP